MRGNKIFVFLDKYFGILICLVIKGNLFIRNFFLNILKICKKIYKKKNPKILIIKLSALGDTVLLIPVIKEIRNNYTNSHITMIYTSINKDVVLNIPYLNESILFDFKKFIKNPIYFFIFIFELYKKSFDISIDFDQWLRISAILSFFSGAKQRIGFNTKGQFKHFIFTNSIKHNREKHEINCFFDLIKVIGVKKENKELEFFLNSDILLNAKNILSTLGIDITKDKFIVFHPSVPTHGLQRHWPVEYFIELALKIIERYNYKILITGFVFLKKEQKEKFLKFKNNINSKIYFCPDVSLKILAAILNFSKLVLCSNTGIMHIACAVKSCVIGLHGPTDPNKWGPLGKNTYIIKSNLSCSPCLYLGFEYRCKTNKCMQAITVEEVFELFSKIL